MDRRNLREGAPERTPSGPCPPRVHPLEELVRASPDRLPSVSVAVIVAVGVNGDGRREVLGMDIGPSEAETFWTTFLRKLATLMDQTERTCWLT